MTASRIEQLARAAANYGPEALRRLNLVRKAGNDIVCGFSRYLGAPPPTVRGVPPAGDWDPMANHMDNRFSFYAKGTILVEPIDMGLAVRIPHVDGGGHFWARALITMDVKGGEIVIGVGALPFVHLPEQYSEAELTPVFDTIFQSLMVGFTDSVKRLTAEKAARIGFFHPKA
jgi:hypothetical protein